MRLVCQLKLSTQTAVRIHHFWVNAAFEGIAPFTSAVSYQGSSSSQSSLGHVMRSPNIPLPMRSSRM